MAASPAATVSTNMLNTCPTRSPRKALKATRLMFTLKRISGGLAVMERDATGSGEVREARVVTKREPTAEEKIALALDLNMSSIRRKARLLDGICEEAVAILKDQKFFNFLVHVNEGEQRRRARESSQPRTVSAWG